MNKKERMLAAVLAFVFIANILVIIDPPFRASAAVVKYEAESATLIGEASAASSSAASGGQYVQMKGGNLRFSVTAPEAGFFTVTARFSQTYDNTKTQNLWVNGADIGSVTFPRTASSGVAFEDTSLLQKVSLNQGANTLEIRNSWGWVDIDYIEVAEYIPTPFTVAENPVNPNASANARKLYSFLLENFQKKVISGVMTNEVLNGNTPLTDIYVQKEVDFIRKSSGKNPALMGFDFMHGVGKKSNEQWYQNYNKGTLNLAENLWNKGGIPTYSWHWRDPSHATESFYTKAGDHSSDGTDFDLAAALADKNSANYTAIIRDIDIVAGYLKQLADKDIPVLWRPLHEAAGGWFWWGAKGPEANKALWILMYDRLTNHHGLNNLIWVWTCEENSNALTWYPGDQYVDIVGRDFYYYPPQKNHGSLMASFENLKELYGGRKLIALSENGSVPYPENLVKDGAGWSWFMPWYGDHSGSNGSTSHNTDADWNTVMNHSYVLTLDKMPGWGNYKPEPTPTTPIETASTATPPTTTTVAVTTTVPDTTTTAGSTATVPETTTTSATTATVPDTTTTSATTTTVPDTTTASAITTTVPDTTTTSATTTTVPDTTTPKTTTTVPDTTTPKTATTVPDTTTTPKSTTTVLGTTTPKTTTTVPSTTTKAGTTIIPTTTTVPDTATTPVTTTSPSTTTKAGTTTVPTTTAVPDTTTSLSTTTAPSTTTEPSTTATVPTEPEFLLGRILDINEEPSIFDALEILKCLVNMESMATGNPAALITLESQERGAPSIFDALEVLKKLVGMDNLIDSPV